MTISELRKENELVNLFCSLAEIPSPSLKEDKVIEWIKNYCKDNNLKCETDDYNNLYIYVNATDSTKTPILLSAHLDVIGDDSPIELFLNGDIITANNRTLGADDKAGVANALLFAKNLRNRTDLAHGGLEVHFTRDEENSMTGIKNTDFSKLNSKYVLVLDSDSLGQCMVAGASYVTVDLRVNCPKGGHSGNDIADKTRENAGKLLANIVADLPQGVFYSEKGEVITSCNLGGLQCGDVNVTNVINTDARATYSIRSSQKQKEDELIELMQTIVDKYKKEFADVANITISFTQKMPMFEKNNDELIPNVFKNAAVSLGITPEIATFHAGAETHIYANETNSKGESFSPYLLGLATVCNMHSARENLDYKTMITGQSLLTKVFEEFNR